MFGTKPKGLTAIAVLTAYRTIATAYVGTKSQDKKIGDIHKMLVASTGNESKFIIRGLQVRVRSNRILDHSKE
jgi:hypothetical protein